MCQPLPDYRLRPCQSQDLGQVLSLEREVLAHLERPDLLRRNTPAMWQSCLQPPHLTLGAWVGEGNAPYSRLIAIAVLYMPDDNSAEALQPLLTAPGTQNIPSANFKICMVHPLWRGHHLQILLGQRLHLEARQRGVRLLCATASPHNAVSIKRLQQLGYRADHTLTKYGFERILFYCFN